MSDTSCTETMTFFHSLGHTIFKYHGRSVGILDGEEQFLVLHFEIQGDLSLFWWKLQHGMDGILQSIGKDGGEVHIRNGQFFWNLNIVGELNVFLPDLGL